MLALSPGPPAPENAALAILQVGFNMKKITKGGVTIKMWDLGGQVRR